MSTKTVQATSDVPSGESGGCQCADRRRHDHFHEIAHADCSRWENHELGRGPWTRLVIGISGRPLGYVSQLMIRSARLTEGSPS